MCGGDFDDEKRKIEPTVIYPATIDDPAMQEEIFGPVLPVLTYSTEEQLLEINFQTPLRRSRFICLQAKRKPKNVCSRAFAFGGGCVNDTIIHIASTYIPFGGVGGSGIGSYHGAKSV